MSNRETQQFKDDKLEPYIRPRDCRTQACVMAPNLAVAKGARLGQFKSGPDMGKWTTATGGAIGPIERLAVRDFVTDAEGITYPGVEPYTTGPYACAEDTQMAYDKGYFLISDLAGGTISDAEITALKAVKHGAGERAYIELS